MDANELFAIDIEAAKIYDSIKYTNNKNNIIQTLENAHTIPYKDRHDKDKVLSMQGKQLLINYIIKNNPKIIKAANPWVVIKCFENLAIAKLNAEKSHLGSGMKSVKFIPSNPKILMNKLKILLAEKDAGNNNVFDEISAIADELRRTGVLSLKQIKNLYKNLHLINE